MGCSSWCFDSVLCGKMTRLRVGLTLCDALLGEGVYFKDAEENGDDRGGGGADVCHCLGDGGWGGSLGGNGGARGKALGGGAGMAGGLGGLA